MLKGRNMKSLMLISLMQSAGWTFYWSKHTQSSEKETITNVYTISSVSLSDGGQYWCRAGRGNPVYYTHYSDALWVNVTDSTKAVVSIKPDKQVFKGETVTLRCDMQAGGDTEWTYRWYKDDRLSSNRRTQEFTVSSVTESNGGKYTCRGHRTHDFQSSEISDAVTLTVSDVAQAVLSVSPQSWLTEGESVTLSCEVTGSSTGWTFSWYRAALYRQGLEQIRDVHGNVLYHVELLSDSRREAGGSYTLSPAALNHTGVYVCRAERGEPAYQTQYSTVQTLWITGSSPPASLIISPSRTQHFSAGSLSLSCEGQSDSTGWRVRRYTHSGEVSDCSSVTGSTCSISSLHTSLTGVYWCQSESGGGSDPLNITVHNGDVILDIPVHPVSEGDSLTLHCLFRSTKPSNLTADFYKDGSLLQTQTTGEMIIRTVSKSDEGLYHCKHPERGESPQSWLSVRGDSAAQPSDDTYAEIMTTNGYRGNDEAVRRPNDVTYSQIEMKHFNYHSEGEVFRSLFSQSLLGQYGAQSALSDALADPLWTNSRDAQRKKYEISNVDQTHAGDYTCKGTQSTGRIYTHTSAAVTLTVSAVKVKPTITSNPEGAALTGNTVTLYCKLHQSAGWTFYWSKHTQSSEKETITNVYTISSVSLSDGGQYWCRAGRGNPVYYTHYSDALWVNVTELLSDSRREAGGSYTLSPAALNHTGVYVCRAERGEPAYQTQYSTAQTLWITGSSPPASLIISPSRTQHFSAGSLSLSCEGQSDSTGWRVRRYTHSGEVSDCSSVTGSTCSISSLHTSLTGVYWCQSESGGGSDPLNITVHRAPVSALSLLSSLMAVSSYLLVSIVLGVKFYRARAGPDEDRTEAVMEAGSSR
ncbi:hypothetical protein SRHO_G00332940 [Serrasalmus rhombeus]